MKSPRLKNLVILTIISLLCFCAMITFASLTQLSNTGVHVNKFNSAGMWAAIAFVAILYLIPLILYVCGIKSALYAMTPFCVIGIMIMGPLLFAVIAVLITKSISGDGNLLYSIAMASSALLGTIANIMWLIASFKKKKQVHIQAS
ncbi:hypothetical protein CN918_28505 [Priestia megaterium]|nr:hypothetical protein CN918_28505 [Priestia megaterium]